MTVRSVLMFHVLLLVLPGRWETTCLAQEPRHELDLTRKVSFQALQVALPEALSIAHGASGVRIVCALGDPETKASIVLADAPAWRAFDVIGKAYGLNWWPVGHVIVMRPVPKRHSAEGEERTVATWNDMSAQGLIAFLSSLSPTDRESVFSGEMIRLSHLTLPQLTALSEALLTPWSEGEALNAFRTREPQTAAVALLFDPYIQIGTDASLGNRTHFLSQALVSAYWSVRPSADVNRLVPSDAFSLTVPQLGPAGPQNNTQPRVAIKAWGVTTVGAIVAELSKELNRRLLPVGQEVVGQRLFVAKDDYDQERLLRAVSEACRLRQRSLGDSTVFEARPTMHLIVKLRFSPAEPELLLSIGEMLRPLAMNMELRKVGCPFTPSDFLTRREYRVDGLSLAQRRWLEEVIKPGLGGHEDAAQVTGPEKGLTLAPATSVRLGTSYLLLVANYKPRTGRDEKALFRATAASVVHVYADYMSELVREAP